MHPQFRFEISTQKMDTITVTIFQTKSYHPTKQPTEEHVAVFEFTTNPRSLHPTNKYIPLKSKQNCFST